MENEYTSRSSLPEFSLWKETENRRVPLYFDIDVTARCNNNCRHCYINLPASDREAEARELTTEEIRDLGREAASMGAVWCLISGGEPLIREDFPEIYMALKREGLLISVFTNACLVTDQHIELFKKYPPRDIEVSVYGVTEETYEAVTRKKGSFRAFMSGLNRLQDAGIDVRLKTMAIRSNVHELPEISEFCRERTGDFFRFDPLLHLRYDRDERRNAEIRSQRLTPEEVARIESADAEHLNALENTCKEAIPPDHEDKSFCNHLFHCGAGNHSFCIGYDGTFRLCSSLHHPDCIYDLRRGSLRDAWDRFVPEVKIMTSHNEEFMEKCRGCRYFNLCLWCPAHAYLEEGKMDTWVRYFCEIAHARAEIGGHSEKGFGSRSR